MDEEDVQRESIEWLVNNEHVIIIYLYIIRKETN
jgi:hypothetical protein